MSAIPYLRIQFTSLERPATADTPAERWQQAAVCGVDLGDGFNAAYAIGVIRAEGMRDQPYAEEMSWRESTELADRRFARGYNPVSHFIRDYRTYEELVVVLDGLGFPSASVVEFHEVLTPLVQSHTAAYRRTAAGRAAAIDSFLNSIPLSQ